MHGHTVTRALRLDGRPALLSVELVNGKARARVEARRTLLPHEIGRAHTQLLRLLGLTLDPTPFERRTRTDPDVRRLVQSRRGLRIPQTPDAFEGLVWAIVGQQVNLAFAFTCRNRLIDLAGARAGGGLTAHPTPAEVARLEYTDLTKLQYSQRKAEYLIDASRAIASGDLNLEGLHNASATTADETLMAIRGLGRWSVNYILMRSLGFADCVPVGDSGLVRALQEFNGLDARPGPDETLALMERFAPHRSLATFHLWKTLGGARMTLHAEVFASPIADVLGVVDDNGAVKFLDFIGHRTRAELIDRAERKGGQISWNSSRCAALRTQVEEYFAGTAR